MDTFELLFAAGALGAFAFFVLLAAGRGGAGKWQVAAALSVGFAAYSAIPILREGPLGFVPNHTVNYWGVQVFWDLAFALSAALFLAAPRARAVGMNFGLWLIPVALGGSIGLLALLARLFWLEERGTTARN